MSQILQDFQQNLPKIEKVTRYTEGTKSKRQKAKTDSRKMQSPQQIKETIITQLPKQKQQLNKQHRAKKQQPNTSGGAGDECNRRPFQGGRGMNATAARPEATDDQSCEIRQDLARSAKIRPNLARFGEILQDLARSGKIWRDLAKFRVIWQDLARSAKISPRIRPNRFGKIGQDLGRSGEILQDFGKISTETPRPKCRQASSFASLIR